MASPGALRTQEDEIASYQSQLDQANADLANLQAAQVAPVQPMAAPMPAPPKAAAALVVAPPSPTAAPERSYNERLAEAAKLLNQVSDPSARSALHLKFQRVGQLTQADIDQALPKKTTPNAPTNAAGEPGPWKPEDVKKKPANLSDYAEQPAPAAPFGGGDSGNPMAGAYLKQLDTTMRDASSAAVRAKDAQVEAARLEGEKSAQLQAIQNAATDKMAEMEYQRRDAQAQFVAAQNAKIAGLMQQANSATISPDRILGGIGGHVMAAIATGLGAWAQSINGQGGPNLAAEQIDKAIAMDVEKQRQAIGAKQGAVDTAKSELGMLRQQFGDDEQAAVALQLVKTEAAKRKLAEIASNYSQPEIQNRAAALTAELDGKMALMKQGLMDKAMALFGAGGANQKPMFTIPGLQGGTADPGVYKEMVGVRQNQLLVNSQVANLRTAMQGIGATDKAFSTETSTRLKAQAQLLLNSLRITEGMKQATKDEQEHLEKLLGDPTAWRSGIIKTQLEEIANTVALIAKTSYEPAGFSEPQVNTAKAK